MTPKFVASATERVMLPLAEMGQDAVKETSYFFLQMQLLIKANLFRSG